MMTESSNVCTPPAPLATQPRRPRPLGDGYDEMLTKKELAAKLKVTLRTIENWQRAGHLPFIKISSVVLFDWAEVRESLHTNFKVCRRGAIRPRLGT
ncbi:MAG TPA: helix-turn-helix domain-containing protein [Verrucomicrobiae bacterium]|nr:helix-turn-helix domain-containing protein [Verrucomicrobiae bacterium]